MTEIELSPNSRFRILDNPDALPGKCALCGSSGGDDRKFVDFGFQLDVYGAVYFCTFCLTELAEAIGFVRRERLWDATVLHNATADQYNSLLNEFQEFENAARTLLRNCHCDPNSVREPIRHIDLQDNSESPEPDSESDTENDESGGGEGFSDVLESDSTESEPEPKPKRNSRRS